MPPTKGRGKKILLNIFLLIFSIIFFLAVLEISLRLVYPQKLNPALYSAKDRETFAQYDSLLGWKLKPNAQGDFFSGEFDVRIKNNKQGLRMDREISQKKTQKYRIAFLGDSFVWGYGVADSARVSEQLEKNLKNTEIINFGVSGYGTDQYYLQLNARVLQFNPDMVIVGFYVNDFADAGNDERYGYKKPLFKISPDGELMLTGVPVPQIPPQEQKNSLLQKINLRLSHTSHTYVFLKPAINNIYHLLFPEDVSHFPDIEIAKKNYSEDYTRYQQLNEKLFCKMSRDLKNKNISFAVVYIPSKIYVLPQLLRSAAIAPDEIDVEKPQKILQNFSKNCGFALIDLYPLFNGSSEKQNLYFKYDGHLSPDGHKYAAQIIADELQGKFSGG